MVSRAWMSGSLEVSQVISDCEGKARKSCLGREFWMKAMVA